MMNEINRSWTYLMSVERRMVTLALAFLILILVTLFCLLGYVTWRGANPQAVVPVSGDASQVDAIIGADNDVWARIQARGKILAGVAADYPPFAFVNPQLQLDGYEVALLQELGRRLNMPVEFSNIAFDGLLPAVQLGQVDLGAGALAVTAERLAAVDFSDVYYLGEDAVVVAAASPVQVTRTADLARLRVGVQRGSAYEAAIKTQLVDTGLMPAANLVTYRTANRGLQELTAAPAAVDAVWMDFLPAQTAVSGRPLKIIARGLSPQGYALAIPKGAASFQTLINQALAAMQADGTLARLAQLYLVAQVQPSPTVYVPPPPPPLPTPTQMAIIIPTMALPVAGGPQCSDALQFVADLNYDDNDMLTPARFTPGQLVQKGWRLRNTGTCTWDSSYRLVYTPEPGSSADDGAVAQPVALYGRTPPGAEVDVYVVAKMPAAPGRHRLLWSLQSPRGETVGEPVWIGAEIGQSSAAVQPTPGAVSLPAPSAATEPPPSVFAPAAATPVPGASDPLRPAILAFTVDSHEIAWGTCVLLSWQFTTTTGQQSALYRDDQQIASNLELSGEWKDCPETWEPVTYRLTISSPWYGPRHETLTVNVEPVLEE